MKYTIDAQGKRIGRVASQAAARLMGKSSTSFAKNAVSQGQVEIINASKADVPARKKQGHIYVTYTGHRGGLNQEKLEDLINRKGMTEVFKRAIKSMIPDNKLREPRLKNLIIKE